MEAELENLRKIVVKKKIRSFVIVLAIEFVLSFAIFGFDLSFFPIYIFMFFIPLFVSSFAGRKEYVELVEKFKMNVVHSIMKSVLGNDTIFEFNKGIPKSTIDDTGMMDTGDSFLYNSNDYCKGSYQGVKFEFSDVLIQEEHTDSEGDSHTVTLFRGQWYIFDFNKRFKAPLQVCEKHFGANRTGFIFSKNRQHKVKMEDVSFNKEFTVYAKDDHDAFYVLTPNTMERIKEVNRQVPGKLLFCFKDNILHIGVNNSNDLFELNIYKKIDLNKSGEEIKRQLEAILKFVNILNLSNDLFIMEGGD